MARLQSRPARGEQLATWIRAVLLHHTGFLVGMQGMQVRRRASAGAQAATPMSLHVLLLLRASSPVLSVLPLAH